MDKPKVVKSSDHVAAIGFGESGEKGKVCGAKAKRTGKPCQIRILGKGGRCYLHGGASTGPKTSAGREQSRQTIMRVNERRQLERQAAEFERLAREQQLPAPPQLEKGSTTGQHDLQPELRKLADTLAPEQYAYATARDFAPGGKYNPARRRQRYAEM